jgi:DNA-binding NtrC family response regulator
VLDRLPPKKSRIILADDDEDFRGALAEVLRARGHDVIDWPSGVEVRAFLDDCALGDRPAPRVHALVTDLRMPHVNGFMLLEHLTSLGYGLPTIVITAFDDVQTRRTLKELGALATLPKPFEVEALEALLERVQSESD